MHPSEVDNEDISIMDNMQHTEDTEDFLLNEPLNQKAAASNIQIPSTLSNPEHDENNSNPSNFTNMKPTESKQSESGSSQLDEILQILAKKFRLILFGSDRLPGELEDPQEGRTTGDSNEDAVEESTCKPSEDELTESPKILKLSTDSQE
ncbi:unnamed protein product [Hymenolepis diminuta]|uniref:GON4L n=1 Tax=Hymenolepis diminuta TaxID=6216 RepID=A0A0R3SRH5_HYMDI|nr:unnamed protein product [Hymenolepis diminuta]VUZ53956.1 unnamed protein product [Hymenolepis diminuta]